MNAFGKLYIYKILSQSNNNIESSNQLCYLKKVVVKLYTIYFQVGTLIRFAFSRQMQFMLCERDPVVTPMELATLKNKPPMSSTKKQ